MKAIRWLGVARWVLFCGAPFFALSLSCSDNSISNACTDPLGSEDIIISRCNGSDNWAECYFCFEGKKISTNDTCYFGKCFKLYADSPSSDWVIWAWYFKGCAEPTAAPIADLGAVSCLGEVTLKPADGYAYSITPKVNHGYVVKLQDSISGPTYGRFYIQKILKNNLGHDTTLYITRQYPF